MIKARIGNFCLLPFDKLTIRTKQNITETREVLVKETKHAILSEFRQKERRQNEIFYGEVGETDFIIKRAISYKNSFIPTIKGTIKQNNFNIQTTDINIKMRMNMFMILVVSIWFVGLIFIISSILVGTIGNENNFHFPIIMLVFGYFSITGFFSYETSKTRKLLIDIFEGEEI